eukprot:RCo004439
MCVALCTCFLVPTGQSGCCSLELFLLRSHFPCPCVDFRSISLSLFPSPFPLQLRMNTTLPTVLSISACCVFLFCKKAAKVGSRFLAMHWAPLWSTSRNTLVLSFNFGNLTICFQAFNYFFLLSIVVVKSFSK